eukprot:gene57077-biopygen76683
MCAMICSTGLRSDPRDLPPSPVVEGISGWRGLGFGGSLHSLLHDCGQQGETGVRVHIDSWGCPPCSSYSCTECKSISGRLKFFPMPASSHICSGEYSIKGQYQKGSLVSGSDYDFLEFTPVTWISNPCGYTACTFTGKIQDAGADTIVWHGDPGGICCGSSGSWFGGGCNDCTRFAAQLQESCIDGVTAASTVWEDSDKEGCALRRTGCKGGVLLMRGTTIRRAHENSDALAYHQDTDGSSDGLAYHEDTDEGTDKITHHGDSNKSAHDGDTNKITHHGDSNKSAHNYHSYRGTNQSTFNNADQGL